MPLTNPATGSGGASAAAPLGVLGLMATTPTAVPSGYTWTYAAQRKDLPAYTPTVMSTAFGGSLLDLSQAGRLSDLNSLRVAYENLRVFTENLAQQHNAISIALRDAGLIAS